MTVRSSVRADRIAPALLTVMVLWLAIREAGALDVGDVFWHLRTGDLILDDGLPRVDPYSWTAGGKRWQPNSWLGDVLWALVRSAVGPIGISLLAGVTVIGVSLLLYRAGRRRHAGPAAAAFAAGVAVVLMSPFIAPRPLLFGFALAPVAIEAAKRNRAGSRPALLVVAVVLAAWSNLHGSFVTGVGIVVLIAAGWAIDTHRWRRPLVLAATAVLAALLNPFGASGYLHAFDVRDESVNIDEWQPLALDDARGILVLLFMLAVATVIVADVRRARKGRALPPRFWEDTLVLVALAGLTVAVIRTGAFFLIAAAPTLALGLTRLRAGAVRRWAAPRVGPILVGLGLAGVILAAQQAPDLAKAGEPGERFSESVVAAIPQTCVLLNEYDLGGFIIDRRWPDVRVSQDGRNDLYGAAEITRQERLLESVDADALTSEGITCVLADRDRPLAGALTAASDWAVAAESTELVLMVRERG